MKNILTEAFKQLSEIDQNVFNADENGLKKLDTFLSDSNAESDDVSIVIDPNAETEEDIQDSYVGKILCRCVVCQSDIMKDESELHKDEDFLDVVNCGEECPMCQSTDGYKIIGRIAPYEETTDLPNEEKPQETPSEVKVVESFKKQRHSLLKEDLNDNTTIADILKIYFGSASKGTPEYDEAFATFLDDYFGDISDKSYDILISNGWNNVETEPSTENGHGRDFFFAEKDGVQYRGSYDIDDEISDFEDIFNEFVPDDTYKTLLSSFADYYAGLIERHLEPDEDYNEESEDELEESKKPRSATSKLTNYEKVKNALKTKYDIDLDESVDSVKVEADGQKVEVKPEGDKTIVEISNASADPVATEEVVAPIDDAEQEEIENKLDTPEEDDEEDVDIDEFDETEFDELGESFLKKVYENVDTYKTTSGSVNGDKLMLEGVITFKSGKRAKTNFVFESHSKTKTGKLKFLGENLQFAKNKAFILTGKAEGKKFISESLNYRYSIKDSEGKSHPLYGTVKR